MMTCRSGLAAFSARSVSRPFMPGIITSSSTMSGGSPCLTDASISSPREYDARLVAAQRQERPQVVGERGIVVDDGDVGFFQLVHSARGNAMTAVPLRSRSDTLAGDQQTAAVLFDDSSRQRQSQAQPAALFIE